MARKEIPESWLEMKDRREWRKWLERNHDKEQLAWLRLRKAGAGVQGLLLSEAVSEALCFGWIDGRVMSQGNDGYLLRLTPRRKGSLWSKVNRDRAEALIKQGLMTEAGYKAIEEAKHNGLWDKAYTSRVDPDMPEDLIEALSADPTADSNFREWSASDKSVVVFWIGQAKRKETSERRIRSVVACAHAEKSLDTSYLTGGGKDGGNQGSL
jgi:uncharacterized protein YdeI (YjbR/CyaY-like superfamily)